MAIHQHLDTFYPITMAFLVRIGEAFFYFSLPGEGVFDEDQQVVLVDMTLYPYRWGSGFRTDTSP